MKHSEIPHARSLVPAHAALPPQNRSACHRAAAAGRCGPELWAKMVSQPQPSATAPPTRPDPARHVLSKALGQIGVSKSEMATLGIRRRYMNCSFSNGVKNSVQ